MNPPRTVLATLLLCATVVSISGAQENHSQALQNFSHLHRHIDFHVQVPALPVSTQEWPDVSTPRKFSYEAIFELAATRVHLHVYDLMKEDGAWWLEEVMAFLFVPEVKVESALTGSGYELHILDLPGGRGVYPQTEALVSTGHCAFRFICLRCDLPGAREQFLDLVNTIWVLER